MQGPDVFPDDDVLIAPLRPQPFGFQHHRWLWIALALIGLLLVIFVSLLIVITKTKVSIDDQGANVTDNFQIITDEIERAGTEFEALLYSVETMANVIEDVGRHIAADTKRIADGIDKIVRHIP